MVALRHEGRDPAEIVGRVIATRALLKRSGKSHCIENVVGPPLIDP
jgi:hypothetical protein